MTALPLLPAGVRITDINGNPVPAAKLKLFQAATTNPITAYADADATAVIGTVVHCDASGYPVTTEGGTTPTLIYTTEAAVKVVITDGNDAEIVTHDNLMGVLPSTAPVTSALPVTPVVSKVQSYQVTTADRGKLIQANAASGLVEISLLSGVTAGDGFTVGVRNDTPVQAANLVVVKTTGGQTIRTVGGSFATSIPLKALGQTVWLVSDGATWTLTNATPNLTLNSLPMVRVESRGTTPPSTPAIGNLHILTGAGLGAWSAFGTHDLVEYTGNGQWAFHFHAIPEGTLARIADINVTAVYEDGVWKDWNNLIAPAQSYSKGAKFVNRQPDGSGGGAATTGAWRLLPLNTRVLRPAGFPEIDNASLQGGYFSLPTGAYRIRITQPFYGTLSSRIRLTPSPQSSSWNNSRYSDVVVAGGDVAGTPTYATATAVIDDEIFIDAASETFAVEYFVGRTVSDGLGTPHGGAGVEDYCQVLIEDLSTRQGAQGQQGEPGESGNDAAYSFTWRTETTGAPISGGMRGNSASYPAITSLAISDFDVFGGNQAASIATWDDSTTDSARAVIRLSEEDNPAVHVSFRVVGTIVDNGVYSTIPVAYIGHSGALSNGDRCALSVLITGDRGSPGVTVPDVGSLPTLAAAAISYTNDFVVVWDQSAGALVRYSIGNLGIQSDTYSTLVSGINSAALGTTGGARAGFGILGFPSTTFALSSNGIFAANAFHQAGVQLAPDVISLGNPLQPSQYNIKWIDHNNTNGGFDHPHLAIGSVEAAGSGYPYTVQYASGRAGGAGQPYMSQLFLTNDSAGSSNPRLHIAAGDNTAIGVGMIEATSEMQGTFLHLHTGIAGLVSHTHYTNAASGFSGNRGLSIGIWADGTNRIWSYENEAVTIGVNNAEMVRVNSVGMSVGKSLNLGQPLEPVVPFLVYKGVASGAVLTEFRVMSDNVAGDGQHAMSFAAQDNAAGTVRGLIKMPGPLRTATATITIATPGVVTWAAHSLLANSLVRFTTTGALPTGLTPSTLYYVSATNLTANTFELSATAGGASIATSGTQSGVHTITSMATNQGRMDLFTEDGTRQMALVESTVAIGGSRLLIYDRTGVVPIEARATSTASYVTVGTVGGSTGEYRVRGTKVVGARDTGWTAASGAAANKGAFVAAAAGTASVTYIQAELQDAKDRVAALEARIRAYDAALVAHGLIGA